jgi:hypothetical protein
MKATFRKSLVVAGTAAALAGVTSNSFAAIHSDVGEAYLVPFSVWGNTDPAWPDTSLGSSLDTIYHITVPSAVGGKTIPNVYTANNTTPNNGALPPNGTVQIGLDQSVFDIFGPPFENETQWFLHWIFYDYRSGELANGPWEISPEDYDSVSLRDDLLNGSLENVPGYMLWVTAAGYAGNAANFTFVVDSFLVADNTGDTTEGTNPVFPPYSEVAFQIPSYPLADGSDTPPTIRPDNHVVEAFGQASPIYSAISTYWPVTDAQLAQAVKVIDLSVSDRTDDSTPPDGSNIYHASTLLVFWNDTNGVNPITGPNPWAVVNTDLFNPFEEGCSRAISIPNELTLFWFTPAIGTDPWGLGGNYARPSFLDANPGVPGLLPPMSFNWTLSNQAQCENSADAFIRFQLPLVSNTTRTSMAAFSLQTWWNGMYLLPRNDDDDAYPTDEANDRGTFLNQANKFF